MKHIKTIFFLFSILFVFEGNSQQLQTLIDEAVANNPEIQKFELQYQRASERVNEVNTLPNTELGVGYFLSEPETRTGAQRFKLSAKQMMPWFGTIPTRENYMSALADAKYVDITIAKRKLMASVAQSYYQLYANVGKQAVIQENIQLLETYETIALTSVEVGKASAVDVLRLQMRQNELQQLQEILKQQYIAEQAKLNQLLNRDVNISINTVNELIIPEEKEQTQYQNIEIHPELLKFDKLYESVAQSELLNQKENSPMVGFGLDYINVAERPEMNFSDNGKDIVMPMVSVSIPVFNNKFKSVTKQNQLQQQELKSQRQERLNTLQTRLSMARAARASACIQFNTATKNFKQAKDAENILIRSYETGTIDFNDVLDIQELQLKFQMNQIEAVTDYYNQSVIINYLTYKR